MPKYKEVGRFHCPFQDCAYGQNSAKYFRKYQYLKQVTTVSFYVQTDTIRKRVPAAHS